MELKRKNSNAETKLQNLIKKIEETREQEAKLGLGYDGREHLNSNNSENSKDIDLSSKTRDIREENGEDTGKEILSENGEVDGDLTFLMNNLDLVRKYKSIYKEKIRSVLEKKFEEIKMEMDSGVTNQEAKMGFDSKIKSEPIDDSKYYFIL